MWCGVWVCQSVIEHEHRVFVAPAPPCAPCPAQPGHKAQELALSPLAISLSRALSPRSPTQSRAAPTAARTPPPGPPCAACTSRAASRLLCVCFCHLGRQAGSQAGCVFEEVERGVRCVSVGKEAIRLIVFVRRCGLDAGGRQYGATPQRMACMQAGRKRRGAVAHRTLGSRGRTTAPRGPPRRPRPRPRLRPPAQPAAAAAAAAAAAPAPRLQHRRRRCCRRWCCRCRCRPQPPPPPRAASRRTTRRAPSQSARATGRRAASGGPRACPNGGGATRASWPTRSGRLFGWVGGWADRFVRVILCALRVVLSPPPWHAHAQARAHTHHVYTARRARTNQHNGQHSAQRNRNHATADPGGRTLERERAAVGEEKLERLGAFERAVRQLAVVRERDAEAAADYVTGQRERERIGRIGGRPQGDGGAVQCVGRGRGWGVVCQGEGLRRWRVAAAAAGTREAAVAAWRRQPGTHTHIHTHPVIAV